MAIMADIIKKTLLSKVQIWPEKWSLARHFPKIFVLPTSDLLIEDSMFTSLLVQ